MTCHERNSRYYCAQMKCPGCMKRIRTPDWKRAISPEIFEKYVRNAIDILTLRCVYCDEPSTRFVEEGLVGEERKLREAKVMEIIPANYRFLGLYAKTKLVPVSCFLFV